MTARRHIFHALLAASSLLFGVQGAAAFFPIANSESSVREGELCEISYTDRGDFGDETLTPARDLGNGIVTQEYIESGAKLFITIDCSTEQALVLGTKRWSYGVLPDEYLAEEQAKYFASSLYRAVTEIEDLAVAGTLNLSKLQSRYPNLDTSVMVNVANKIVIDIFEDKKRHKYDLSCGCKLFYPESVGAP